MAWWEVLLQTSAYPQYLAVLGMVALAAFLLFLDFNRTIHRAFALLLLTRAAVMLLAATHGVFVYAPPEHLGGIGDPRLAELTIALLPYLIIPMPFLIVRFATTYPRRRTWFGRSTAGQLTLLAAVIFLEVAYFARHELMYSSTPLQLSGPAGNWTTTTYSIDGPLSVVLGLMTFGFAALALLFSVDYRRLPSGPRKEGIFVVALGFLLNSLYDGWLAILSQVVGARLFVSLEVQALVLASIVPALLALFVIIHHGVTSGDARALQMGKRTALLSLAPLASAIFPFFNPFNELRFVQLLLTGFWRLWLPALVTYALVRHQLFDIDLKIKFAVKQSTLAGLAFVGFLVLSEILEAIITSSPVLTENVPESLADITSLGIAVGLTYALNPVQRFAGQVANRAMPNTVDSEDYLARKKLEVYRATLEGAIEDGAMTEKEQQLVDRVREQLGLSKKQTEPILAEVQASYEGKTIGARAAGT